MFGKILKNECDEEFRFIQMHVRDTLVSLLRVMLRDKYQFKGEKQISANLEQIINGGVIEEWMWRRIIERMYDSDDARLLEKKFQDQMGLRESEILEAMGQDSLAQVSQRVSNNKKMSREEANAFLENK